MSRKGILSLGLCGALLASPATSFAAEENTSTGPQMIYTENGFTNVESGEQRVLSGNKPMPRSGVCLDIDGGNWCKGQKMNWKLDLAQYSVYKHSSRVHKATAMANGNYTYSGWKNAGASAEAQTSYYGSLNTYRSYYDVQ